LTALSPDDIARAAAILRGGGLVAFPTETVYGLGADATNPDAVRRIFAAKGRPADHPLIVHVADAGELGAWAREIPENARHLADAFWPGPLTLILRRSASVSDLVTGGQDTVGVRVPSHPVAQLLLRAFGGGIAAPSANRFGRISPTTAEHVRSELGDRVDLVLDGGASEVGIESAIVDVSGDVPRLLRPGMIGAGQIETVLGCALGAASMQSPRVSGMLEAHYAPTTPLIMLTRDAITRLAPAFEGPQVVLARCSAPAGAASAWMEAPEDPRGYAHELYRNLRALDAGGYARIIIEALPDTPEWAAVRDRLTRAARGAGNTGT
jgi:L-threonylcarbamoyladenylate synthase